MSIRRLSLVAASCLAASGVLAASASAAHESNNRIDFKPTTAAPGADGHGVSNYIAGASSDDAELWNTNVRVTGLQATTRYTFWAENAVEGRQPETSTPPGDKAVCSFVTDAAGSGGCTRQKHTEPALAVARIRLGGLETFGTTVLEARRMPADADAKLDDGEIESVGANRDK